MDKDVYAYFGFSNRTNVDDGFQNTQLSPSSSAYHNSPQPAQPSYNDSTPPWLRKTKPIFIPPPPVPPFSLNATPSYIPPPPVPFFSLNATPSYIHRAPQPLPIRDPASALTLQCQTTATFQYGAPNNPQLCQNTWCPPDMLPTNLQSNVSPEQYAELFESYKKFVEVNFVQEQQQQCEPNSEIPSGITNDIISESTHGLDPNIVINNDTISSALKKIPQPIIGKLNHPIESRHYYANQANWIHDRSEVILKHIMGIGNPTQCIWLRNPSKKASHRTLQSQYIDLPCNKKNDPCSGIALLGSIMTACGIQYDFTEIKEELIMEKISTISQLLRSREDAYTLYRSKLGWFFDVQMICGALPLDGEIIMQYIDSNCLLVVPYLADKDSKPVLRNGILNFGVIVGFINSHLQCDGADLRIILRLADGRKIPFICCNSELSRSNSAISEDIISNLFNCNDGKLRHNFGNSYLVLKPKCINSNDNNSTPSGVEKTADQALPGNDTALNLVLCENNESRMKLGGRDKFFSNYPITRSGDQLITNFSKETQQQECGLSKNTSKFIPQNQRQKLVTPSEKEAHTSDESIINTERVLPTEGNSKMVVSLKHPIELRHYCAKKVLIYDSDNRIIDSLKSIADISTNLIWVKTPDINVSHLMQSHYIDIPSTIIIDKKKCKDVDRCHPGIQILESIMSACGMTFDFKLIKTELALQNILESNKSIIPSREDALELFRRKLRYFFDVEMIDSAPPVDCKSIQQYVHTNCLIVVPYLESELHYPVRDSGSINWGIIVGYISGDVNLRVILRCPGSKNPLICYNNFLSNSNASLPSVEINLLRQDNVVRHNFGNTHFILRPKSDHFSMNQREKEAERRYRLIEEKALQMCLESGEQSRQIIQEKKSTVSGGETAMEVEESGDKNPVVRNEQINEEGKHPIELRHYFANRPTWFREPNDSILQTVKSITDAPNPHYADWTTIPFGPMHHQSHYIHLPSIAPFSKPNPCLGITLLGSIMSACGIAYDYEQIEYELLMLKVATKDELLRSREDAYALYRRKLRWFFDVKMVNNALPTSSRRIMEYISMNCLLVVPYLEYGTVNWVVIVGYINRDANLRIFVRHPTVAEPQIYYYNYLVRNNSALPEDIVPNLENCQDYIKRFNFGNTYYVLCPRNSSNWVMSAKEKEEEREHVQIEVTALQKFLQFKEQHNEEVNDARKVNQQNKEGNKLDGEKKLLQQNVEERKQEEVKWLSQRRVDHKYDWDERKIQQRKAEKDYKYDLEERKIQQRKTEKDYKYDLEERKVQQRKAEKDYKYDLEEKKLLKGKVEVRGYKYDWEERKKIEQRKVVEDRKYEEVKKLLERKVEELKQDKETKLLKLKAEELKAEEEKKKLLLQRRPEQEKQLLQNTQPRQPPWQRSNNDPSTSVPTSFFNRNYPLEVATEPIGPYRCEVCNVITTTKTNFEQHINGTKHKKKVTNEPIIIKCGADYYCQICKLMVYHFSLDHHLSSFTHKNNAFLITMKHDSSQNKSNKRTFAERDDSSMDTDGSLESNPIKRPNVENTNWMSEEAEDRSGHRPVGLETQSRELRSNEVTPRQHPISLCHYYSYQVWNHDPTEKIFESLMTVRSPKLQNRIWLLRLPSKISFDTRRVSHYIFLPYNSRGRKRLLSKRFPGIAGLGSIMKACGLNYKFSKIKELLIKLNLSTPFEHLRSREDAFALYRHILRRYFDIEMVTTPLPVDRRIIATYIHTNCLLVVPYLASKGAPVVEDGEINWAIIVGYLNNYLESDDNDNSDLRIILRQTAKIEPMICQLSELSTSNAALPDDIIPNLKECRDNVMRHNFGKMYFILRPTSNMIWVTNSEDNDLENEANNMKQILDTMEKRMVVNKEDEQELMGNNEEEEELSEQTELPKKKNNRSIKECIPSTSNASNINNPLLNTNLESRTKSMLTENKHPIALRHYYSNLLWSITTTEQIIDSFVSIRCTGHSKLWSKTTNINDMRQSHYIDICSNRKIRPCDYHKSGVAALGMIMLACGLTLSLTRVNKLFIMLNVSTRIDQLRSREDAFALYQHKLGRYFDIEMVTTPLPVNRKTIARYIDTNCLLVVPYLAMNNKPVLENGEIHFAIIVGYINDNLECDDLPIIISHSRGKIPLICRLSKFSKSNAALPDDLIPNLKECRDNIKRHDFGKMYFIFRPTTNIIYPTNLEDNDLEKEVNNMKQIFATVEGKILEKKEDVLEIMENNEEEQKLFEQTEPLKEATEKKLLHPLLPYMHLYRNQERWTLYRKQVVDLWDYAGKPKEGWLTIHQRGIQKFEAQYIYIQYFRGKRRKLNQRPCHGIATLGMIMHTCFILYHIPLLRYEMSFKNICQTDGDFRSREDMLEFFKAKLYKFYHTIMITGQRLPNLPELYRRSINSNNLIIVPYLAHPMTGWQPITDKSLGELNFGIIVGFIPRQRYPMEEHNFCLIIRHSCGAKPLICKLSELIDSNISLGDYRVQNLDQCLDQKERFYFGMSYYILNPRPVDWVMSDAEIMEDKFYQINEEMVRKLYLNEEKCLDFNCNLPTLSERLQELPKMSRRKIRMMLNNELDETSINIFFE